MKKRQFFLPPEAIEPDLAPGRGSCIATNLITVEGKPVGFMYREKPDGESDSGWRFFAGSESQDYVDDANNMAIYDVNTIANYDQDIVALLDAPCGAAFERDEQSGAFMTAGFPGGPGEDEE